MNSKRLYITLIGLLIFLAVGTIGGTYVANTLLQKRAHALLDEKAIGAALDSKQNQLIRDKQDIQKYADLNTIAKAIVPQDKDQAEAVRQIIKIAKESKVSSISSITFPNSTLGGSATTTPVAGAPKPAKGNSNLTQLTPVKGIAGVYTLPITVTVDADHSIPYSSFITFLSNLEKNRRTAQVSSVTVNPLPEDPAKVSFTLVIDEYIKP